MTNLGLGVDLSQICAINFWQEWKQGCVVHSVDFIVTEQPTDCSNDKLTNAIK